VLSANAEIYGVRGPIEELNRGEWDQAIDMNLRGTFLTIK